MKKEFLARILNLAQHGINAGFVVGHFVGFMDELNLGVDKLVNE